MKLRTIVFSVFCAVTAAVTGSAQAGETNGSCTISNIATFKDRFHVKCSNPFDEITAMQGQSKKKMLPYYAVEANSPLAASAVHVALAALVHKRKLTVYFDDNANANPPGCDKSDCRRMIALEIQ